MGYDTYFSGRVTIEPPLSDEELDFLREHFASDDAWSLSPWDVNTDNILLEDDWKITHTTIDAPNGWVRQYEIREDWVHLIQEVLGPHARLKASVPCLQGHLLNGEIFCVGEEREDDVWKLIIRDSVVYNAEGYIAYYPETRVPGQDERERR